MTSGIRHAHALVIVFAAGCGSATPPPKAPDSTTAETHDSADAPGAAKEAAPTASAEPAATPPSEPTRATLSATDLRAVLQATLDDPELSGYLHTEKQGRSPVKLAGPELPKDLKLVKGSYPVTIVDAPKSKKDPVLVLSRVHVEGNIVTVAYAYDVEGIHGTTKVRNGTSGWELLSSRIVEK